MLKNHLASICLQAIYASVDSFGKGSVTTDVVDLLEEMLKISVAWKKELLYL